ncbi:MAG TPA: DUF1501 domain-containing protein [Acidiphilium sp.]|nr:MAG: hypothetical protein B7Z67_03715 [Acidiphilium sp. 21-60-14]OYV91184.1 MAG: hypothetical protein B7Z57_06010 [Acidiphilium sp. 37-60-79]HQT87067.1 DUF1501 domain-containing protein [Acidiphilium sp.]HQU22886.1 DUF1501 domain-containing protein [Acidiphilium sp.]
MALTLSRRATLLGLGTAAIAGRTRLALAAAPTDRRFIVILLRGALDGLNAVIPYGDPDLARLRAPLIPSHDKMLDLGGFFALHPALKNLHSLYQSGEALPVHAIAGPYRTRSHFEAQDLLQTGVAETSINSGWLNRLIVELHAQNNAINPASTGLAVGMGMPLLLRGPARIGSYAPIGFAKPSPDLYHRIAALNAADPVFGPAIRTGLQTAAFDQATLDQAAPNPHTKTYGFDGLAQAAGTLLAAANGPRICAFQLEGWDTHVNQINLLTPPLAGLDSGIATLKSALGPAWRQTTILIVTEFGRTARINGTHGTDHGTATIALLLGGAVAGGKVRTTWPGLKNHQLFQNRDLAPTTDIRSLAKGAILAQFPLPPSALARIFPSSTDAAPMTNLLRT